MSRPRRPQGRAEVRRALVDAAATLMAERGPSVSVRDVAAAASVNHGLVHRHFGSKQALLAAVMDSLAAELFDVLPPPTEDETLETLLPPVFAATRDRRYWRVLARAVLEGHDPQALQGSFPIVTRIAAAVRRRLGLPERGDAPDLADSITAGLVGTGLGLVMFEPYLRAATGVDPNRIPGLGGDLCRAVAFLPSMLAALSP